MDSNVVQMGDWVGTQEVTLTTTGGWYDANTYPAGNWTWYPNYSYPVYKTDKVAELKAWLDGYCTDRKMTEKALKRIRAKIEEFGA